MGYKTINKEETIIGAKRSACFLLEWWGLNRQGLFHAMDASRSFSITFSLNKFVI